MSSSIYQTMKNYFEYCYENTSYTLHELTSSGLVVSKYFTDYNEAKDYGKSTPSDSTVYIFKTRCVKVYEALTDSNTDALQDSSSQTIDEHDEDYDKDYDPKLDFTNMTVCVYGRGYLLKPPHDSDYFGHKYFHNGWWISSQNGWFFKAPNYDWLIKHGAQAEDDTMQESDTNVPETSVSKYGKGYLVKPNYCHPDYGEKYYHGGWWMEQSNGWFFKKDAYEKYCNEDEVESESESEDVLDFTGMKVAKHGKGFLLIPPSDHADFGQKYYSYGWWMPRYKAWFFKSEHYEELLECGATIEEVVDSEDDNETQVEDAWGPNVDEQAKAEHANTYFLEGMCFSDYGRGYMLYAQKKHCLYGSKYLLNGYWNQKAKGWFFKKSEYDRLTGFGAIYIKSEEEPVEENTLNSSITEESFEYVSADSEFTDNMPKFIASKSNNGKNGWLLTNNFELIENNKFDGGKWVGNGYFLTSREKKAFMNQFFDI